MWLFVTTAFLRLLEVHWGQKSVWKRSEQNVTVFSCLSSVDILYAYCRTYVSTLQRANFSENSRRRIDRISRCFLASVKVKYSTEVNGLTQQRYGDATSGWSVPLWNVQMHFLHLLNSAALLHAVSRPWCLPTNLLRNLPLWYSRRPIIRSIRNKELTICIETLVTFAAFQLSPQPRP